jgi:hypothetical protein
MRGPGAAARSGRDLFCGVVEVLRLAVVFGELVDVD